MSLSNGLQRNNVLQRHLQWTLLSVLAVCLLAMWIPQIDDGPIISDAGQSLRMAVNLARHGTLSLDSTTPFTPTNFREPLFPIVTAAEIRVIDAFARASTAESYFAGKRLQFLKYQNVLWLAFLSASAYWIARALTQSFYAGLLAVVLINVPFRPQFPALYIDDLMNEIPAAALLVPASALLALGFVRRQPRLLAFSGALFGALTLVKAMALYVFAGTAGVLACLYFAVLSSIGWRIAARDMGIFLLSFACIVAPWVIRNRIEMGTSQITQRASYALEERALENQMSAQEYAGALYLWAPVFKAPLGRMLGFSPEDVRPGGRLQRLNDDPDSAVSQADLPFEEAGKPDQTVTFYRKARAVVGRAYLAYLASGRPFPDVAAEDSVKKEAMAAIEAHPWRHLALTPLFLWRSTVKTTPILLAALAFSIWRKRYDLALLVIPTLGFVAGYALTSPYFSRYDFPMHLVANLVLVILVVLAYHSQRRSASV